MLLTSFTIYGIPPPRDEFNHSKILVGAGLNNLLVIEFIYPNVKSIILYEREIVGT